jgi:hypothetical protein
VVSAADLLRSLISDFSTGVANFLSSSSSRIFTRAEWTPFQTYRYSENLAASGFEPGTSVLKQKQQIYKITFDANFIQILKL